MKLQLKPLKLLSICLRLTVVVRLLQLTAHAHLIREGGGGGGTRGETDLKRELWRLSPSPFLSQFT